MFAAIATWVATLVRGRPPGRLARVHRARTSATARTSTRISARRESYPGFVGEEGEYPVDVILPPTRAAAALEDAASGSCWRFRRCSSRLALGGRFSFGGSFGRAGGTDGRGYSSSFSGSSGGLATVSSILGWFASLARGRMPKGLRDAGAYGVGYSAQVLAYLLLVTDRYPNADPTALLAGGRTSAAPPVHLDR